MIDTEQTTTDDGLTGRLRVLKRILPAYIDDLADIGATDTERQVSRILNALHAAMMLGRTDELAAIARKWQNGTLVEMLAAVPGDDQSREDAVAGLRAELPDSYSGIGG